MSSATSGGRGDGDDAGRKQATPFTETIKQAFLLELESCGALIHAARAVGFSSRTVYNHIDADPEFAERVAEARKVYTERLEQEALHRATVGARRLKLYKGALVFYRDPDTGALMRDEDGKAIPVTEFEKSDRILELLLKANDPAKYRENINIDANVQGGVMLVPEAPQTVEEWEQMFGEQPPAAPTKH